MFTLQYFDVDRNGFEIDCVTEGTFDSYDQAFAHKDDIRGAWEAYPFVRILRQDGDTDYLGLNE